MGGFKKRSKKKTAPGRLITLMSTMPGKHGKVKTNTEVPRQTLKDALNTESNLFNTEDIKGKGNFFIDCDIKFESPAIARFVSMVCCRWCRGR